MHKISRYLAAITITTSAALLAMPAAFAQDAAKAKPKAAAAAPMASPGKADGPNLYTPAAYDFMLKQRLAQNQPDSPELRAAVRDELNTRELLVREARKAGVEKNAAVKTEIDLAQQTVLVRAYMADYLKAHPVSDAALRKEYDQIKSQIGDREYKVRHILVD